MHQYDVEADDLYNMEEKGFLTRITSRSKRAFPKAMWTREEATVALQGGSRE